MHAGETMRCQPYYNKCLIVPMHISWWSMSSGFRDGSSETLGLQFSEFVNLWIAHSFERPQRPQAQSYVWPSGVQSVVKSIYNKSDVWRLLSLKGEYISLHRLWFSVYEYTSFDGLR